MSYQMGIFGALFYILFQSRLYFVNFHVKDRRSKKEVLTFPISRDEGQLLEKFILWLS